MKEIYLEMSDVDTGEVLINTKVSLVTWKDFWSYKFFYWKSSFQRGCEKGRELQLSVRCRSVRQEETIDFKDVY